MDFSIIVPCYNLQDYIKNLLLSFHMLNIKNIEYEIIFVLDNCTDKTEEIIHNYMKDMNYKIITGFEGSPGGARNLGLNLANGKYIWFVDGDDWIINPEILQQAKRIFQNTNEELLQIKFVSNFFNMEHYSMVWQYIFSKELIGKTRFNTKQNHEDDDFTKEILAKFIENKNNNTISIINIPTYFYNFLRPGSQTNKERENLKT